MATRASARACCKWWASKRGASLVPLASRALCFTPQARVGVLSFKLPHIKPHSPSVTTPRSVLALCWLSCINGSACGFHYHLEATARILKALRLHYVLSRVCSVYHLRVSRHRHFGGAEYNCACRKCGAPHTFVMQRPLQVTTAPPTPGTPYTGGHITFPRPAGQTQPGTAAVPGKARKTIVKQGGVPAIQFGAACYAPGVGSLTPVARALNLMGITYVLLAACGVARVCIVYALVTDNK